jgi:hypothetical protein
MNIGVGISLSRRIAAKENLSEIDNTWVRRDIGP